MPDQKIRQIMTAMDPTDVSQMAMIECLRSIADGNKKLGQLFEGLQVEVRDVRERVIRIEASEFKVEVAETKAELRRAKDLAAAELGAVEKRVEALELDKHHRDGALSLVEWIGRNWPAIIGFVALMVVVVLANNGRFHLS